MRPQDCRDCRERLKTKLLLGATWRGSLRPAFVITVASSGIGLMTARAAARAGAKVMLAARNQAALRESEPAILESGGMASYAVTDVTRRKDIEALADATVEAYGKFDT
jgi:NADP-dependent 3-hydroxy acid dehydrogenase YdfG